MSNQHNTTTMDDPNWWRENYGVRILDDDTEATASTTESLKGRYGILNAELGDNAQRKVLRGFTKTELVELGAFAIGREDNVRPNNLEGRIHNAFARENWETKAPPGYRRKKLYALGNDSTGRPREGNWTASNPIVWRALEPCLRLVSKFIENAGIFPWVSFL
jgi:hypothetical protein